MWCDSLKETFYILETFHILENFHGFVLTAINEVSKPLDYIIDCILVLFYRPDLQIRLDCQNVTCGQSTKYPQSPLEKCCSEHQINRFGFFDRFPYILIYANGECYFLQAKSVMNIASIAFHQLKLERDIKE